MNLRLPMFVVLAAGTIATAEDTWAGKRVMPKKTSAQIVFNAKIDNSGKAFKLADYAVLDVREHEEGQIRIFDGYHAGWSPKADFVLIKDAPAYWTARLKTNPRSPDFLRMRGIALVENRQYDDGLKDLNESIK